MKPPKKFEGEIKSIVKKEFLDIFEYFWKNMWNNPPLVKGKFSFLKMGFLLIDAVYNEVKREKMKAF